MGPKGTLSFVEFLIVDCRESPHDRLGPLKPLDRQKTGPVRVKNREHEEGVLRAGTATAEPRARWSKLRHLICKGDWQHVYETGINESRGALIMKSLWLNIGRLFGRHKHKFLHLTFFTSLIGSIFGWCFIDYFGGTRIIFLMVGTILTGLYEIDHLLGPM